MRSPSSGPAASRRGPFRLRGWTVVPARNLLLRPGRELRITPREMDLLVHLAKARGEVVSKHELLADVWRGACVVEHVLPKTLSKLRASLGDDARSPRFVETIPSCGYRLLAMPAPVDAEATGPRWSPRALATWSSQLVAGLALLALGTALGHLASTRREDPAPYEIDVSTAVGGPGETPVRIAAPVRLTVEGERVVPPTEPEGLPLRFAFALRVETERRVVTRLP